MHLPTRQVYFRCVYACVSYDYFCVSLCDAISCTTVLRPTPRSLSRLTDALWTTSPSPVRACDLTCSRAGARLWSVRSMKQISQELIDEEEREEEMVLIHEGDHVVL